MFNRDSHIHIDDWFLFYLFMAIPIVNILLFLALVSSSSTNKSLRSFVLYHFIVVFLIISLIVFIAFQYTDLFNEYHDYYRVNNLVDFKKIPVYNQSRT